MGMSPSADLYYGFDLGDMTDRETWDSLKPEWLEDDGDWEEVLAEKFGWTMLPYPQHLEGLPQEQRFEHPDYKTWSANLSLVHQRARAFGVLLGTYGYLEGGETSYYVAITASVQTVGDWGSIELKPLVVEDVWDAKLIEFMQLMELSIPVGESPGWHLNCSYG